MDSIIEDALALCLEAQSNETTQKYYLLATETPVSRFNQNFFDTSCFIYKNAKVPFFLEKEGILKIIDREWLSPVFFRPKGFFRVEVNFDALHKWVHQQKINYNYKPQTKNYSEPHYVWKPDKNNKRGSLQFDNDKPMFFKNGVFGGVNLLITNLNSEVSGEELRNEIAKYSKIPIKNPNKINLAKWKQDLRRRKRFFEYFQIIPLIHKLVLNVK